MTTAEWTADAINMLLVVLIVCVSVAGIIAVKGFVGERMLRKRSIWFASVFGFLFMAYLVLHVLADLNLLTDWDALSGLREILPADWAQIFLVLGLVTVTGFYALMAFRQASTSVKMAEDVGKQTETLRQTVSISVRPFVSLKLISTKGGGNYPFEPPTELHIQLQNTGKGPARNLVVTCEGQGKKVEYSKIELPSLNIGDRPQFSIHRTTAVGEDEVRVAYLLLKALYNDELGEIWSTTLQIDRDGKWKAGEIITERG